MTAAAPLACRCQGHAHNALADRHPAPNGYCLQCPCTTPPVSAALLASEVRGLMTLQWSWGGLLDGRPAPGFDVCLVRSTARGTPGPTLCGRDRFAPGAPGWSVGGGITGPDVNSEPCAGCVEVRDRDYPHLPVGGSLFRGMFAKQAATSSSAGAPS